MAVETAPAGKASPAGRTACSTLVPVGRWHVRHVTAPPLATTSRQPTRLTLTLESVGALVNCGTDRLTKEVATVGTLQNVAIVIGY